MKNLPVNQLRPCTCTHVCHATPCSVFGHSAQLVTGEIKVNHTEDLRALYWYCADYHSGQWSREYRLMCRIGRKLARRQIRDPFQFPLHERATRLYAQLVEKYQ